MCPFSETSKQKDQIKETESTFTKLYLGMPIVDEEKAFFCRSILTNKWSGSNKILILQHHN